MYTTDLLSQNSMLHRGSVTYSSTTTGEIKVKKISLLSTALVYLGIHLSEIIEYLKNKFIFFNYLSIIIF